MPRKSICVSLAGFLCANVVSFSAAAGAAPTTSRPSSSPSATSDVPTCATIADKQEELDRSPIVAILETRLAGNDRLRLVERNDIKQVIEEQMLGSAFGAEGVGQRRLLGSLLKADILVLLRAAQQQGSEKHIDVVVCETKRGLRLRAQAVPWSDGGETAAKDVETVVSVALSKHANPNLDLCAVPPFLTKDFTHEYDHLQTIYAQTMEQRLSDRPDMVVVELAEAQAISTELALAGDASNVARQLPLYILGEYENRRQNGDRTVSVALTVKRGEKTVRSFKKDDMAPQSVGAFLYDVVNQVIGGSTVTSQQRFDVDTEARQLTERAETLRRIGDWSGALDLLNVSTLIKPKQTEQHYRAIELVNRLLKADAIPRGETDPARHTLQWLTHYRTGLYHWEQWVLNAGANDFAAHGIQVRVGNAGTLPSFLSSARIKGNPVHAEIEGVAKEEATMILGLLEHIANQNDLRGMPKGYIFNLGWYVGEYHLPYDRRLVAIRRLIRASPQTIDDNVIKHLARMSDERGDAVYREFLNELSLIPDGRVQNAVRDALSRWPQPPVRSTSRPTSAPSGLQPGSQSVPDVRFELIEVWSPDTPNPDDRVCRGTEGKDFQKWFPVWNGSDLAVTLTRKPGGYYSFASFLMKQKGQLELCSWSSSDGIPACFDGRYLWELYRRQRTRGIRAVGIPSEGDRVHVNRDELPPVGAHWAATAMREGQILISSAFSKSGANVEDRAWIAVCTVDPTGAIAVDVIHQARTQQQPDWPSSGDMQNLDLVFRPRQFISLCSPDNPSQQRVILLRRQVPAQNVFDKAELPPLMIDPQQRSVGIMPSLLQKDRNVMWEPAWEKGTMYWIDSSPLWFMAEAGRTLWRLGSPDFQKHAVVEGLKEPGDVVLVDGQLYVLGTERVWRVDQERRTTTRLESFAETSYLPTLIPVDLGRRRLFHSQHYGLILQAEYGGPNDTHGAYRVKIEQPLWSEPDE